MKKRFLISGGGTGGHIFPALAIANQIKKENPEAEILFIGAQNKMEMKRVPEAGYHIEGLDVYGIKRDFSLSGIISNLKLPFVLMKTMRRAKKIISEFNPDVAIGVGGFASGPALQSAIALGVPALIQEQNSYPGVTNKILSQKVKKICVAYDGLERYFPAEKIVKTGNPIRAEILNLKRKNEEAYQFFGFSPDKKTVLVMGGSLGARSMNTCMRNHIDTIAQTGVQVLWQTGEAFYNEIPAEEIQQKYPQIKIVPFIKNMDFAYSISDYIVSRAGALAIAELTIVGAPVILVPFPYASEDHQTKNAAALANENAAILIPDKEASEKMVPELLKLIEDEKRAQIMAENIKKFALPDAIHKIVKEVMDL